MGCVYRRKNSLWIKFKDEKGQWCLKPSGFKVGDERKARGLLERIENLLAAGKQVKSDGPLTVKGWSEIWLDTRRDKGVVTIKHYEARLKLYILPVIGDLRLDAVRVHHIQDIVSLARKADLAPRTIRHIYFTAHTMFEKAAQRDLILGNPCKIDSDDLPAKVDKDPEWRALAIHTRDELEMIISDDRISEWHRVFWSILFLTGVRFGEAAARRWRHYQPDAQPLGRLVVNTSWNSELKKEKETKTKQPRDVPVHPLLAEILADWRTNGWKRVMGRSPSDDDLIVPFGDSDESIRSIRWDRRHYFGEHIDSRMMLTRFHADLALIGSRPRRQHDARRTFISLCLGDGARWDILRWITHARPRGAAIDDYTSLVWTPLCEEVAKLKACLRRPPERIAAVANAPESLGLTGSEATPRVTPVIGTSEFPTDSVLIGSMLESARRGNRTPMAVNR